MAQSIKKNFLYSSVLTTANYIFPFITYPYVSRVLGVSNIGICNFVDSIINYFVLFSMMGIGTIGIREVAKHKANRQELNKAFSSLLLLNTLSTTLMLVCLVVCIYTVPKLYEYRQFMWVGAGKLVFNYLLIEWLYKGLEDFRYITIRSLILKVMYVASVFIFVRTRDDYFVYYLLVALMIAANAVLNLLHSRRFVSFSLTGISLSRHTSACLILGVYGLLTSMYTSFNVAYLGFVHGETEVGYYTTATKIYAILLALYSAFTGVMLPRMSSLISEQRYEEFKQLLRRSLNLLLTFSVPIVFFCIVMAPQIIAVISGSGYEGAITPMRIAMPLMLIVGYEQILIIQALMPLKADKQILRNSVCGAAVGLTLNFLLVPTLRSVGSTIVWMASEIVVLCSAQRGVNKIIGHRFPYRIFVGNILFYLPMLLLLILLGRHIRAALPSLAVCGVVMVAYAYVLNVHIIKNKEVINLIEVIRKRTERQMRKIKEMSIGA